jgi:hypothetical protein
MLFGGVAAVTAGVAVALGALAGASLPRSISLGFYMVGSFLLVGGFLVGHPRPLRTAGHDRGFFRDRGEIRRTTAEERREAIGASATYIVVGILEIVLGIATDSRVALF